MNIQKQYQYKPKWSMVFLVGSFFGLGTALFAYLAITNDRGLIINGLIRLSPYGARLFYWILAVLSFAFVLAAAFMAFVRLTNIQRIAVTQDGMLFPARRWTKRESHVSFTSMTAFERLEIQDQAFLHVYASGQRYTVVRDMLPDQGDFDEIVSILKAKIEKDQTY
jgi:hypothetical protein